MVDIQKIPERGLMHEFRKYMMVGAGIFGLTIGTNAYSQNAANNGIDSSNISGYSMPLHLDCDQSMVISDAGFIRDFEKFFADKISSRRWENEKSSYEEKFSELTRYSDIYESSSKEYNLGTLVLKSMSVRESGGYPRAQSRAGAKGIDQIMPYIAVSYNMTLGRFIDDRLDPRYALPVKAQIMRDLINQYHNDLMLSLIAYNFGSGNLDEVISDYGKNWDDIKNHIPNETRDFVLNVYFNCVMLSNQENFNINITQLPIFSKEYNRSKVHIVSKGESLDLISRKYQVSLDEIKRINTRLRNFSKLPENFNLRIPKPKKKLASKL